MLNISQTEVSPKLQNLVQQAILSHEPVKLSIGHGQTAILISEQDYYQLLNMLNEIQCQEPKRSKQRVFGSSKGMIKMADDFDAPLDDFKDYM